MTSNTTEQVYILTAEELEDAFKAKREIQSQVLGNDAVVGCSGFLDATNGIVMTSKTVLGLVFHKARTDAGKSAAKRAMQEKREEREKTAC